MDKEMHYHTVDLSGVSGRTALHRRLEKALGLPSWYGRNLDALFDVLTDGSAPLYIRFTAWEELQEGDPLYFDRFRRVVSDAEKELTGSSFVFAGEEPDQSEEPDQADEPDQFEEPDQSEEPDQADELGQFEEPGTDEEYQQSQDTFFRT